MKRDFKPDIYNFEYNKKYSKLPSEHKWCSLTDKEANEKYFKDYEDLVAERYIRRRVQSDLETTGQMGQMK